MTAANLDALALVLVMAAYACGGGTDYGAGFWDLVAGGADRGARPRALIDYAMAPVWEANNVWLVFALVLTWTGFPVLFESVFSTAWIALTLAALGLVLRGAGFAFRKPTRRLAQQRRAGATYAISSALTPFFFGTVLGGIASGRIPVGNRAGDPVTSWWNPTSIAFGVMAVAGTAFLGAVYLTGDAGRFGVPDLVGYFRRRAVASAAALLVVEAASLAVWRWDAAYVFRGLGRGWALGFAVLTVVATVGTAALVGHRLRWITRITAVVAVGSAVFAWALAQRPYLLPTALTIEQAAADPQTQRWLVAAALVALALVVPALALLYRLDLTAQLVAEHGDEPAEPPEPRIPEPPPHQHSDPRE
ncbi:cytochrome d ubiquinol oxidase subunit II [Gandjariella thermophila]|uniref:Cytochrome D ubiquinol oxidase subunit II n=1 Tax=Gandjariella thermophila TaxID=1931992 RepID=A0A4D4JC80_9PSEU|nr:cytochrome d ubiquinol oxidase subunit II [Gandjariella thermophila]GDY31517.1 cytochrome D ubiquinol oxidase subunit II [Gandjariella thermophila]